jgi:hypothetical protein
METSPQMSCYTEIHNGLDLVMVRLAGPTSFGRFYVFSGPDVAIWSTVYTLKTVFLSVHQAYTGLFRLTLSLVSNKRKLQHKSSTGIKTLYIEN